MSQACCRDINGLRLDPDHNRKDGHLKEALSSEPSLPAAIDHLLSVELIKDVESRGAWPDEVMPEEEDVKVPDMIKQDLKNASAPTARSIGGPVAASSSARAGLTLSAPGPTLSAPGPTLSASNSTSSRKSRSKRSQITVPLVDTLQRSSPLPSPAPSRGQSPSRGAGSRPPKQLARPSDNAWGTMASLAAHLSDLLPHPAAHFISYLHSPRYFSPYSAVRASLSDLPASPTIEPDVRSQQVLEEMYGIVLGEATLQTQADLELCTRVAGGDVATVMDLMDLMAEISMWGGDDDLEKYDQYSVPTSPVPSAQARLLASPRTTASPSLPTSPLMPPPPGLASHDDDHPPSDRQSAKEKFTARATKTPILANGTTEPFHAELLMRPTSNAQTKVVIPDRIIPGAKAGVSSTANPTAHDNFGATSSFAPLMGRSKSQPGRGRQVHPLNWRQVNHEHERQRRSGQLHPYASHIPSYARGALPHDATPGSLFTSSTSEGGLTVEECLRRAQAERDKRETSVRLAGRHYKASSKAATRGSVAGSYAIRARESADAARQWELKAARMVVMSRLEKTGHTIDLHNLTIMEAKEVVLEAAERWWEREKVRSFAGLADASAQRSKTFVPNRGLTVITGVGRHSAGKTGVLGPAVANTLQEHGWRIERGERTRGYITVHGRIA